MKMLQKLKTTVARSQWRGWNRCAIRDQVLMEYRRWWESIRTRKWESARNFDNQLHCLQSTWPLFDENNEPILTGYKLVHPKSRISTLRRDYYTCRICCRRQFYYIGEEKRNISSWYTCPSIDLQVHHIIPLPSGPNELDNLLALCKTCHEILHTYYTESRKNRGIFEAVFYSFHKCLDSVPRTLPLPDYSPVLVSVVDSYLWNKQDSSY